MLKRMLRYASQTAFPARDRAMILLSVKAGLRACEIAKLDWSMVLDARGRVADTIAVRDVIAKKYAGRRIPMHPELKRALQTLRHTEPFGPVIRSARGGHFRPNSTIGSPSSSPNSDSTAAPRTPAGARSSPRPPGTSIGAADHCATCSSSPATRRSKRRSGT